MPPDHLINPLFDEILELARKREEYAESYAETPAYTAAGSWEQEAEASADPDREMVDLAMKNFLDTVHEGALRKITAVMYLGHRGEDQYHHIYGVVREWEKEECISKILEKAPLSYYLRHGKSRLEKAGFSLEKL